MAQKIHLHTLSNGLTLIAEEMPFDRSELTNLEAFDVFDGQPYKQELVSELPKGEAVSIYNQGLFTDLCRGPHVPHTGFAKNIKLIKILFSRKYAAIIQ